MSIFRKPSDMYALGLLQKPRNPPMATRVGFWKQLIRVLRGRR
jgi:hypothetical protein